MIQLYCASTDVLTGKDLLDMRSALSVKDRQKYDGYRRLEDKLLQLTSMALLRLALEEHGFGAFQLSNLLYSETGRPYFPDSTFDFNISHTEGWAVLAFSSHARVGVDVERINEIDLSDFEQVFTQKEWDAIDASHDKIGSFYHYWTLLESAIKGDGRGLSLMSSDSLHLEGDRVYMDGKEWFASHRTFDPDVACCLSTDVQEEVIELLRIQVI